MVIIIQLSFCGETYSLKNFVVAAAALLNGALIPSSNRLLLILQSTSEPVW
jgi:hypothetical protein